MIKPPFTLLILKSPHRPVAIRIGVPLFVLLLAAVPLLTGAAGYGLFMFFSYGPPSHVHTPALTAEQRPEGGTGKPSSGVPDSTARRPEISGLFVSPVRGGGTEVTFSLSNTVPGEQYYLWIVANPDAAGSESALIYPRNPVFRGLPVDYRNGIPYDRSQGGDISLTIGEDEPRLTVEKLRILVYSPEGKILTDKQFAVGQDTRSSSP